MAINFLFEILVC